MSNHIKISVEAIGDPITAITETLFVAKAIKEDVNLLVRGHNIKVRPTSDYMDLIEIYRLKGEIKNE